MASTEPLTGITVQDQNDAATGGTQIGNLAKAVTKYVVPRFATTSARDTAYTNKVAAGSFTMDAGLQCTVAGKAMIYNGSAWVYESSDAAWSTLSLATANWGTYTNSATYVANVGYRREGDRVFLRGWLDNTVNAAANTAITTAGAIPAALRPAVLTSLFGVNGQAAGNPPFRMELTTAGTLFTVAATTSGSTRVCVDDVSWPIG